MAGSEDSKSELHTLKKRPHVVRHFILAALLLVLSAVSLFAWQAVRRDGLNDELRSAVRTGDEAKVKELLESGADATRLIRKKDESSFNLWERITGKVHPSSDARQARPILLTACTIGNGAIVRDLLRAYRKSTSCYICRYNDHHD